MSGFRKKGAPVRMHLQVSSCEGGSGRIFCSSRDRGVS